MKRKKTSVTSLVTKHAERFHLPGETLGATSERLRHRIFTTDDRPINVKQYQYP